MSRPIWVQSALLNTEKDRGQLIEMGLVLPFIRLSPISEESFKRFFTEAT